MKTDLTHLHPLDRASVLEFAADNEANGGMIFNTPERPIFALQYLNETDAENHLRICEIDGGACYNVYPSLEIAEKAANNYNAKIARHNNATRYKAVPLPQGIPCESAILDHIEGE